MKTSKKLRCATCKKPIHDSEPDEPFPRLNDSAEMRCRIRMLRAVQVAAPVLAAGGILVESVLLVRSARG
jgi:hypothetical protein